MGDFNKEIGGRPWSAYRRNLEINRKEEIREAQGDCKKRSEGSGQEQ